MINPNASTTRPESQDVQKKILHPRSAFHLTTLNTESALQQFDAAFYSLRRRQDVLRLELKKPGIAADKQRLRELLMEWERIARALRGQSAPGGAL